MRRLLPLLFALMALAGTSPLLAQGNDIVPIPGTRRKERLAENIGSAELQLTAEDLARITEILPEGAAGARYGSRKRRLRV